MIDAMYIGATGMHAQQLNVDVVANNLANVNTLGFKKNKISFQDAYYRVLNANSPSEVSGQNVVMLGMGAMVSSNSKSFVQGDVKPTDAPLDLAIQGDGLFEVILPDGTAAYTRLGSFKVNENGVLSTQNGYELKEQIQIPVDATEVLIDASGKVSARLSDDPDLTTLGQIDLATFTSLDGLRPIGENLFLATEASGLKTTGMPGENGLGSLQQGFLESSNVKLAEEMVNLVLAQRAYELNAKVIQASDDMLSISNNLRR